MKETELKSRTIANIPREEEFNMRTIRVFNIILMIVKSFILSILKYI